MANLTRPTLKALALIAALTLSAAAPAQQNRAVAAADKAASDFATPIPGFDPTSIDSSVNPCNDFYKFACGKFAGNHPIPADQAGVDQFYALYNVNTQSLRTIVESAAAGGPNRSPNAQKIGDYYGSCMNTDLIEKAGLAPIQPLLDKINSVSKSRLTPLIGELHRQGVDVFFSYGEMQDFKDASKQIAYVDQGGLGLPERDYYTRTGDKDKEIRKQYVEHVAKMLVLSGDSPEKAKTEADAIMAFETALANASVDITTRRDPEKIYHPMPVSEFLSHMNGVNWPVYEDAVHSPHLTSLNNMSPDFFPVMHKQITDADINTLHAYMRYHLLTTVASRLPKAFDDENFDFYARKLNGTPEQRARWKRCSNAVNGGLGEALGQLYVDKYFAGDSKAKMLQMVGDIEAAMDRDIDQIDWMSAPTKVRAKEKLHGIANKIGYPDKWRDYSSLVVKADDPAGNLLRANAFENDRQLNKIGKPVDHSEWGMTPPTVNAYYDPSMNDINFPAGILQPSFYDKSADDATNYGHIGAVIGHELTHGFDDEGRKFDAKGNLSDWWTPADAAAYKVRSDCLVNEYSSFVAVDDVHVKGELTLGENTADNGGLVLAYMAYLDRAKKNHVDLNAKINGFTAPQRLYIGWAQNWCENSRPESVRNQVLTDPHSPDHFRANGAVVNAPGFAAAFSCKAGSPMTPTKSCRVW